MAAHPLLDEAAGVPGSLPIIWGIFTLQRRAFDTRNPSGGNDEDMGGARRGLEHGKASLETVGYIDLEARKRNAEAAVGSQAQVINDEPQLISVGCRYRRWLTCEHRGDQAYRCREMGKFAQEKAGPKYCLSLD
jgi:hypothetical protein